MTNLSSMIGRELEWVRPTLFKRIYELRSGDTLVGELKIDHSVGWTALKQSVLSQPESLL